MGQLQFQMKIYLLFFGITRSLQWTIDSIRQNVISPAQKYGDVSIFCHFFQLDKIINLRSGENGAFDSDEYRLLRPDWISLEPPDHCLTQWNFEEISRHGDWWNDDYASLKNLIHQLHSLYRVTEHALQQQEPGLVVFCRPDLRYHDSLDRSIRWVKSSKRQVVLIPDWQWWGGLNDRFSIVSGEKAIRAYGQRILKIPDYLAQSGGALQGEKLLKFSLDQDLIPNKPMRARACRVRIGGVVKQEAFISETAVSLRQRIKNVLRRFRGA